MTVIIPIAVTARGFTPALVGVTKDQPTTLVFTRTSEATCAKRIAFPELGLERPLPLNQSVRLQVPVSSARTLSFQCGMGMHKSLIVIE